MQLPVSLLYLLHYWQFLTGTTTVWSSDCALNDVNLDKTSTVLIKTVVIKYVSQIKT